MISLRLLHKTRNQKTSSSSLSTIISYREVLKEARHVVRGFETEEYQSSSDENRTFTRKGDAVRDKAVQALSIAIRKGSNITKGTIPLPSAPANNPQQGEGDVVDGMEDGDGFEAQKALRSLDEEEERVFAVHVAEVIDGLADASNQEMGSDWEYKESDEKENPDPALFGPTLYPCGRCGRKKARMLYQLQTRSADEGMTTFMQCICGQRFRVG
eukprot:jgi/Bigna1/142458/aug1.70_g17166